MYDRTLTVSDELDLVWRRRKISVATGLYLLMHISFATHLCLQIALVGKAYTGAECAVRLPCISSVCALMCLICRGMFVQSDSTHTPALTASTNVRSRYSMTLLDFCISLVWSVAGDGESTKPASMVSLLTLGSLPGSACLCNHQPL